LPLRPPAAPQESAFFAVDILTLALGIGASTVIFRIVYNVFFDAFPYKDFDRSVVFEIRNVATSTDGNPAHSFPRRSFERFANKIMCLKT
jgi:hypothetical protein